MRLLINFSDSLKFSEALAAVTLLAVANGAGDVITALVASGTDEGISYNIGSLYGAGLFCASYIMSSTIFSA
jgi:sodium/potassium/calcium exchanger 6